MNWAIRKNGIKKKGFVEVGREWKTEDIDAAGDCWWRTYCGKREDREDKTTVIVANSRLTTGTTREPQRSE